MNIAKNAFPFGFILGLLLPVLASVVYYLFEFSETMTLFEFYSYYAYNNVLTHLISLCAIPNLLIFFGFISKDAYKSAKGVISATLIYTIIVVIIKYII